MDETPRVRTVRSVATDGVAHGMLRAGSDARWPFDWWVVWVYLGAVLVAYFGGITPADIGTVSAALFAVTFVTGAGDSSPLRMTQWTTSSRKSRTLATD